MTGAAGGTGRCIAMRFAEDGHRVAITDRRPCDELAAQLVSAGAGEVHATMCELDDADAIGRLVEGARETLGPIDILVNNAADTHVGTLEELTLADYEHYFRVNSIAPLMLSQMVAPAMHAQKWGRIINVVSTTTMRPPPHIMGYSMSKAALMAQTHGLAAMWGAGGITVNAVSPSFVIHDDLPHHVANPPIEMIVHAQAIKRPATPNDITGTIAFLASEDAAFVTGQLLLADGGLVMLG